MKSEQDFPEILADDNPDDLADEPAGRRRRDRCYAARDHREGRRAQGRAGERTGNQDTETEDEDHALFQEEQRTSTGTAANGRSCDFAEAPLIHMRRLALTLGTALILTASLAAQATQQAPPPKPEEKKADAKAAPSVAGKWNMVTQTDQGTTQATIDIKLDAKKVSGTISSQMGDAPIAGEWIDGKLTFSMTMNGGGGAMELWFTATLKDADNMTGEIDFGQGKLTFTATRAK